MLSGSQWKYLARESVAGFRRRTLTTGVTILIMSSSLMVLAVLTMTTLNLGNLLDTARQGIDMRVFLMDNLPAQQLAELQPRLLRIPGVADVQFISRDMALDEFRQSLGDDASLLALLDANPLPASYRLELTRGSRTLQAVHGIRDEIAGWEEVSDILYNQEWIDVLERWTYRFQMASLVVGLVVFLAAIFVISNTVKLTIASSSAVIRVQKLVGATNTFIRTPFICEGMMQGLLAGTLAMGLLATAMHVMKDELTGLIVFTPAQMAGFVGLCVVLGLIGSWAAMGKYLGLRSEG
ncbi:ABC transporter permease [bacterium]|nr:ABC transporter permease [bacterium]PIV81429.1 MAG: hypothetical protein COW53_04410 [bacterium CG17_big_fil_post_rev_8_21_14_2_50_64_8]PJA73721.1 MAG: hypothetical protein CO151_12455 [bacterium CG_4_9_14_3_um_filter_65_15]